jgi:hypothetical protein
MQNVNSSKIYAFKRINQLVLISGFIVLATFCTSWATQRFNDSSRLILDGANGLYDGSLHVTGVLQTDKWLEYTDSTSATPVIPKAGHAKTFLNKITRQLCNEYDDGSVVCPAGATTDFSGVINVKAPPYNATGNGTTDDSAAFTSAFAAGKNIYVPGGTYIVTNLTMNTSGQSLTLAPDAVLKGKPTTAANMLNVSSGSITITGGTFDGNRANNVNNFNACLRIINVSSVTVNNVIIQNCPGYGIQATDTSRLRISRNRIISTGYIGMFVQTTISFVMDGVVIVDNVVDRSNEGVAIVEGGLKVRGSSSFLMTNPIVARNLVYMPVNPTSGAAIALEIQYAQNAIVSDNNTWGGSMGLSTVNFLDSSISAYTAYEPKTYGLEMSGDVRTSVTGVSIFGFGLTSIGLILDGTPASSNTITGVNISSTTSYGIQANGLFGLTLANFNIQQAVTAYGMNIQSTVNFAIGPGMIDGQSVSQKGILLNTSYNGTITGVTLTNFTQHGILLQAAQVIALDDIHITGCRFINTGTPVGSQLSGGATLGNLITVSGSNIGTSLYGSAAYQYEVRDFNNSIIDATGTGSPANVISAAPGSTFHRTDGGNTTSFYIKETGGVTTSGWTAIGVVISSVSSQAGAFGAPASNQYFDVAQITVTTGTWAISALSGFSLNGDTVSAAQGGIGTAAGNNGAGLVTGDNFINAALPTAAADSMNSIPTWIATATSNTTYYLKALYTISAGTPKAYGRLTAIAL